MALYTNTRKNSAISKVEFTPVSDGNFTFFYIDKAQHKDAVKQWLTSKEVGQEIVAETEVSGNTVYVTHGDKTKEAMTKLLEARGDAFELAAHKKPFNFWALRGGMSVIAHTLSILSAFTQVQKNSAGQYVKKGVPMDTLAFSVLNQVANITNIVYGGQQSEDKNRLHFLKDQLNGELGPHLPENQAPFGIDEKRAELRMGPEPPKSTLETANDVMKENSVRIGEIALRYLGSIFLAFPINKMRPGLAKLATGNLVEAYKTFRNTDRVMHYAGMGYLTGKTLALFSKVPDPYDDTPRTWLDEFREKHLFKNAGLIEAVSGYTTMARRWNSTIGMRDDKTGNYSVMTDWPQRIGGFLFGSGYVVRYFAKFGNKNLDLNEVYAHATDTLAKTPPEKLPQLLADTAASLKENMKDDPVEFGEIFNKMMTDIYRYHHIPLNNLGTEPEERLARQMAENAVPPQEAPKPAAITQRTALERASAPAANHAEAAKAAKETPLGLGA